MEDDEIAACVAAAVGRSPAGARVEPLGGKQGLIVCRVCLPGEGSYVFKAVRESGRRELALTQRLAAATPRWVPAVIAYEEDTRRGLYWLVTRDMGARRLADDPSAALYARAAEALADLQIAFVGETDRLRALGLPAVGPAEWEDIALRTLEAVQRVPGPIVRGHLADLENRLWSVGDLVRDTLALPMALVHGDLHAGNVALVGRPPDEVCLLDWGSAYIGAALLGLAELQWPAMRYLRSQEDLARMRSAYLRAWSPLLGKPGRLERACAACSALVRLELLEEALLRPVDGQVDDWTAGTAVLRLLEAMRAWERM